MSKWVTTVILWTYNEVMATVTTSFDCETFSIVNLSEILLMDGGTTASNLTNGEQFQEVVHKHYHFRRREIILNISSIENGWYN